MIFFPSFTQRDLYKIPQCSQKKYTWRRCKGLSWLHDYFEAMKSSFYRTQKSPWKKVRAEWFKNLARASKVDFWTWKYRKCLSVFRPRIWRGEANCGRMWGIIIFNIPSSWGWWCGGIGRRASDTVLQDWLPKGKTNELTVRT